MATYSQTRAHFAVIMGGTPLLKFPLMCAIQQISGKIGRVTGHGLGGNLRRNYPSWALYAQVGLIVVAHTINLGADLGAMAAALKLLIGGPALFSLRRAGSSGPRPCPSPLTHQFL